MEQRVKRNVTGLLQQQQKQANYKKKKNQNKFAKNILFYHMNRAAPRAISLENHKKNSNTRAVRVWPFTSASVSFNLLSLSLSFFYPFYFLLFLFLPFANFENANCYQAESLLRKVYRTQPGFKFVGAQKQGRKKHSGFI